MQTINSKQKQHSNLDPRLVEFLEKPIMDIDSRFLNHAINYLRSTVDPEFAEVAGSLGSVAIDVAGTGGSGVVKFNTSTAVAFVLASHGVDVIKFGNRSITGSSGSIDFLSALGCLKDVNVADMERVFRSTNLLFLNAPSCYPNLAKIRDLRKKLGRPTIFNFVGPLLNPARPAYRLYGLSNSYMHLLVNQFLKTELLAKRVITLHSTIRTTTSLNEVDELLPNASNTATLIERYSNVQDKASISNLDIPHFSALQTFDNRSETRDSNSSGSNLKNQKLSEVNARAFQSIIDGNDTRSIHFQGIILNAGAAFLASGAVSSLKEGISLARNLIANKSAARKLDQVRKVLS